MQRAVTIDELAVWLKAHDNYAVFAHVMPDGDAAGCAMAVRLALEAMGKRAMVCLPNPVPRMYAGFAHADEALEPGMELPFIPDTAFAVDTSEIFRLGGAQVMFEGCPARAMLDHHETNPGFGDVWHVDGGRIACGELVLELIEALGVTLTKEMAEWLYVAISTDSGHFSFEGTAPATMRAAAKLIEAGVDVPEITRELYHTRSLARTRLLGMALAELGISEDGKVAWSMIPEAMLRRAGATGEDKEGIVNYLLEIEGVECAVLAEERAEGTKFSLRSKQVLDVAAEVAAAFGGGGHARAAGCTLKMPMEEALEKVLAQARGALEND